MLFLLFWSLRIDYISWLLALNLHVLPIEHTKFICTNDAILKDAMSSFYYYIQYTVLDNPVVKKHLILGFIYGYLKIFLTDILHLFHILQGCISIIARIPNDRSFQGHE